MNQPSESLKPREADSHNLILISHLMNHPSVVEIRFHERSGGL